MTHPGERLRDIARRACDDDTLARVIDPLIADLQFEHAKATSAGRIWPARWHVRLATSLAPLIWSVFALGLATLIRRTLVSTLVSIVGVIAYGVTRH